MCSGTGALCSLTFVNGLDNGELTEVGVMWSSLSGSALAS